MPRECPSPRGNARGIRLALCAAVLAASACTGDDESPVATPRQRPEPGGKIVFGVLGEPATLDPYSPVASDLTFALARPVFPSLFTFTPAGEAQSSLAASVDEVPGGVRVELARERWSDGTPIRASDVVASLRRARPPSGFARVSSATAVGPRVVELLGDVDDWPRTLATAAFVMPRGRADFSVSGGPLVLASRRPGLQLVYRRNRSWSGPEPYVRRVVVQFTAGLDVMLGLLRNDRLDAALLPSAVNLDERLDALKLKHADALGWESIYLDLGGAAPQRSHRAAIAEGIDREVIESGLVRDDGRIANTLHPEPGPDGGDGRWASIPAGRPVADSILVSAPLGDELLLLIQRIVQQHLTRAGFEVELVRIEPSTFYGPWARDDPMDVALRRALGAPGLTDSRMDFRDLAAFPLFHVDSELAWQPHVYGLLPNPTLEGPLWNVHEWWVEQEGRT